MTVIVSPSSGPELGQLAYSAYGDYVEWKNFAGQPMPKWEELPEKIQDAWIASSLTLAETVANQVILAVKNIADQRIAERAG